MGIFYETTAAAFLTITVVLGGGAAWLTGRALALSWRPLVKPILYMLLLAGAVRFFHFALAGGTLLSPHYYTVDTAVLVAITVLSWLSTRARQLARQYPWLYRQTSPVSWSRR